MLTAAELKAKQPARSGLTSALKSARAAQAARPRFAPVPQRIVAPLAEILIKETAAEHMPGESSRRDDFDTWLCACSFRISGEIAKRSGRFAARKGDPRLIRQSNPSPERVGRKSTFLEMNALQLTECHDTVLC